MPKRKKSQSEPFALIPVSTIKSKELNALPYTARWMFVIAVSFWRRVKDKELELFSMPYNKLYGITMLSKSRIKRALDNLEEAGFIELVERGRYGEGGYPNRYRINYDDWLKLAKGQQYSRFPRRTLWSPDVNILTCASRWLYILMWIEWRKAKGYQKHPIKLSYREANNLNIPNRTMNVSLVALLSAKLIDKEKPGPRLSSSGKGSVYYMDESRIIVRRIKLPDPSYDHLLF